MAVVLAELLRPGSPQQVLSGVGWFALFVAAILTLFRQGSDTVADEADVAHLSDSVRAWRWALLGLGAFGILLAQTWFRSGTAIAGGDIAPPIGTAWIGRIFSIYGWSGSNLGGPVANQGQLPFAVLDEAVHLAGGSGALAQRIWFTLLIAAILVAGATLARSLGMSSLAGVVVGVVFFLNPMTLSQVGSNDVFQVAMILVAALPAALIAYARGTLRLWQLNVAFAIATPFVGFSFANPPLVGMLGLALLATPALVWARFDRTSAVQCFKGLLIAGAVMGSVSAYWLIPSYLQISQSAATGTLSGLSRWAFTESRSTLANGFWLNTTWGWSFAEYYPYAHLFGHLPLILVRAFLPLLAFVGLALGYSRDRSRRDSGFVRLAGLLSVLALGLILLSNGTRAPGFLLFDPLYHLPYGWLLQEPGRFLLIGALGYALLIGLLIDRIRSRAVLRVHSGSHGRVLSRHDLPKIGISAVAITTALVAGFPLWTGAVIPGPRTGTPSSHVVVPKYWEKTASYLNSSKAPAGAVLVLPADDFYQMPYTWYYGSDSFIPNLLDRHVVVPSGQGYDSVSKELLAAVRLEDSALISHNWLEASRVLEAIGTPIVLVRGDINPNFPGRTIAAPQTLASALRADPYMHAVRTFGLLSLYGANHSHYRKPTNFATIASKTPNLGALDTLPPRTALVTSQPQVGHPVVVGLPPLQDWRTSGHDLHTRFLLPRSDQLVIHETQSGGSMFRVAVTSLGRSSQEKVGIVSLAHGSSMLPNGNFYHGNWSRVGNCNNAIPVTAKGMVGGSVSRTGGPFGYPELTLHASVDAACESTRLDWSGGHVFLRYWARSLSGNAPQVCLWESPSNRCTVLTSSMTKERSGWIRYSAIATPSRGTRFLSLIVYAYGLGTGSQSMDQYANVQVFSLPSITPPLLTGVPKTYLHVRLVVAARGFSSSVSDPRGLKHVLVDGLRNGWIADRRITKLPSQSSFVMAQSALYAILSFAGFMAVFAGALTWLLGKRGALRLRVRPD
ncbi:MAG: hypothetical protein ACYCWN_05225 [Ferrimicrobium sp.]